MSQLTNTYLQSLNNKDLHTQCLRHGLPNIPVTDSSRSVLIRKLLAVAGGSNAAKPKATPTSPKINRSSFTASKQSPRRVDDRHDIDNQSNSSRRSNVHIEPMDIEYDDASEDEIRGNLNTLYPQLPRLQTPVLSYSKTNITGTSTRPGQPSFHVETKRNATSFGTRVQPPSSRSSRSSSLSKSGVMTTSYRQEFSAVPSQENSFEDKVDMGTYDTAPNNYNRSEYHKLMQQSNTQKLPFKPVAGSTTTHDYHQRSAATAKSYIPPTQRMYSSSTSYEQTDEDTEDVLEVTDSEEEDATNSEDYDYSDTQVSPRTKKLVSDSATYKKSTTAHNYSQPIIGARPGLQPRSKVDSYSSIGDASLRGYTKSPKAYEGQDMKRSASNYYADAAVSRSSISGSNKKGPSVFKAPTRRRPLDEDEDAVQTSLRQFLTAIDQKYHIKQVSIMILIFMLSVFIYVMFIQSTDQQISIN